MRTDFKFHSALLLGVLILEWALFRTFLSREIVWGYPAYHDQTAHLISSYLLHEEIRQNSFLGAILDWFAKAAPIQGFLISLEAAVLYFFMGASRATALSIQFFHYAAFQIFAFWLVRKSTSSWVAAWTLLGLILSVQTLFYGPGGIVDFRPDFTAFCLFGIYVGAARAQLKNKPVSKENQAGLFSFFGVFSLPLKK